MTARPALAATSIAALAGMGAPALAHGGGHEAGFGWTFDPVMLAPLLASGLAFAAGTLRLRRRTGGTAADRSRNGRRRTWLFAAGWSALALALVSPLHAWGEHLFTAHMIEHEVIMAVAAPLLVLSRPLGPALWGLPAPARTGAAVLLRQPGLRATWAGLAHPVSATALHAVVLWLWHAPGLFEASLTHEILHRLQHASFLGVALLFWWSMAYRATPGEAFGHLVLTMLQMSVLGALIALAPRVIYARQTAGAALAGLTPLADQQLAGLVMWVPAGTLYAAAALAVAATWIRTSGQKKLATPTEVRP